ncbi:MAG: cyclic nucleotide-binding domain-containing protein, partial [Chthoniobacterales bacterium]
MKTQDEEILRRSALFQFLPPEHFETLRSHLQEEEYEFGDIIVKQGDPADAFYVLITGRGRALKIYPTGEEIPLGSLKPGDSFGEEALAESGTHAATIRCSTAVQLLRLDRADFLTLAAKIPELT